MFSSRVACRLEGFLISQLYKVKKGRVKQIKRAPEIQSKHSEKVRNNKKKHQKHTKTNKQTPTKQHQKKVEICKLIVPLPQKKKGHLSNSPNSQKADKSQIQIAKDKTEKKRLEDCQVSDLLLRTIWRQLFVASAMTFQSGLQRNMIELIGRQLKEMREIIPSITKRMPVEASMFNLRYNASAADSGRLHDIQHRINVLRSYHVYAEECLQVSTTWWWTGSECCLDQQLWLNAGKCTFFKASAFGALIGRGIIQGFLGGQRKLLYMYCIML